MNQHDNYEFHRERMEKEAEQDNKLKESLSDESMDRIFNYYVECYSYDDDTPDTKKEMFDKWFADQPYHELLEIIK